jgi:hypothetical protein
MSWETADYTEWNVWLVDHALRGPYSRREISHIPASPEELRSAVGETAATSEDVEAAFIAAVRAQLPSGRPDCGK